MEELFVNFSETSLEAFNCFKVAWLLFSDESEFVSVVASQGWSVWFSVDLWIGTWVRQVNPWMHPTLPQVLQENFKPRTDCKLKRRRVWYPLSFKSLNTCLLHKISRHSQTAPSSLCYFSLLFSGRLFRLRRRSRLQWWQRASHPLRQRPWARQ